MDLRDQIKKILNEYGTEVERTSAECVRKISQKGAARLRKVSPVRKRNGGKYAKGWTYKVEQKRLASFGTIYNKTHPGLAHLLENGHVTRNGTGRTFGRTPAHVHISPVEKAIVEEFGRQIEIDLGKGKPV